MPHFQNFTPGPDTDHSYKLRNGGGDTVWHLLYAGNGLGAFNTTFAHGAFDVSNSERHNHNDSLHDHHWDLHICTVADCDNNNWHKADSYHVWHDNVGDYDFCRDSLIESHVLPSC